MPRTSGIRDAIISLAQTKFYEEGYINCTVKSIANELDIPSSLVLYHFRQKKYLMEEIYILFETNNQEAISEVAGSMDNPMLAFFVSRQLMYYEARQDEKIERLRYEMLVSENLGFARVDVYKTLVKRLSAYYHLSIEHLDLDVLANILYTATKTVFIDIHDGSLTPESEETLFSTVEAMAPREVGVSELEIQRLLTRARILARTVLEQNGGEPKKIWFRNHIKA